MDGSIHSFQSMGGVDGPGIRYVVFMQGCPLRCVYCHNPDTWSFKGNTYSVDDVFQKILRCRPYFREDGGVTVSGGEPLIQWEFVSELFGGLRREGIQTALDTSGIGNQDGAKEVLKNTDLVLCDLKFSTEEDYVQYCRGDFKEVLSFLKLTEQMQIPLWVRHVIVPRLTDGKEQVQTIAKIARQFSNLKKLELLPFKKICISKYNALGIPFPLEDYKECSDDLISERYNDLENEARPSV